MGPVAVDGHMWAEKVLALRAAIPAEQVLATAVLGRLRAVKTTGEMAALARAGAAIDAVHRQVGHFLRAGRTEAEVGRDIAAAILAAGHERVDFVIVASGPNGASPHHEVSDRVIAAGEPVVVDIGGTTPEGYASDSTRMYCIGAPPAQWAAHYEVLMAAQQAGFDAAQVGTSCEDIDAAGREVMAAAGLGEAFIHRTGHGIGLETHEDPYVVSGSRSPLVAGNAFSIEPGFYFPGEFGARIEDIVIATPDGPVRVNNTTRELVVL
jgi:Xaa-Pro aminopeptidase